MMVANSVWVQPDRSPFTADRLPALVPRGRVPIARSAERWHHACSAPMPHKMATTCHSGLAVPALLPLAAHAHVRTAVREVVVASASTSQSSPRAQSPTPGRSSTSGPGQVGRWLVTDTARPYLRQPADPLPGSPCVQLSLIRSAPASAERQIGAGVRESSRGTASEADRHIGRARCLNQVGCSGRVFGSRADGTFRSSDCPLVTCETDER